MKGIVAYQAFGQICDDYVDESRIPAAETLIAPPKRERGSSPLLRFFNSGWGVASVSLVVALGVLGGIIYAGHRDPVGPPVLNTPPAESETVTEPPTETPTEAPTEAPTEPEDTLPEPDRHMEAILQRAEPMTPAIPEGAELLGETALYTYLTQDGMYLKQAVSRIAVFGDGADDLLHYLYTDVLTDEGTIVQTETIPIHGFFALLRLQSDETSLVLATLEGEPMSSDTYRVFGQLECWYTWTDQDAMSGADMGDVRLLRDGSPSWSTTVPAAWMPENAAKTVQRYWEILSTVLRENGGIEAYCPVVDYFTVTDTPRVYTREESPGQDAVGRCGLLLEPACFESAWTILAEGLLSQDGEPITPPEPEPPAELPNAAPMEPDVPDSAVLGGSTYATDTVTEGGQTLTVNTRMAVWRDADDPTLCYLYRDILRESGEIIASETLPLHTPFGLAQNSLDGSFRLYIVTAAERDSGALFSLTAEDLVWSDLDPDTGESTGQVTPRHTLREELSWSYEVDMTPASQIGIDRYWEMHSPDIVAPWMDVTVRGWQRELGEMGMEGSGYLTFWIDTLLASEELDEDPEALRVLYLDSDEETRMETYFMMNTGYEFLQSWFRTCLLRLGYQP